MSHHVRFDKSLPHRHDVESTDSHHHAQHYEPGHHVVAYATRNVKVGIEDVSGDETMVISDHSHHIVGSHGEDGPWFEVEPPKYYEFHLHNTIYNENSRRDRCYRDQFVRYQPRRRSYPQDRVRHRDKERERSPIRQARHGRPFSSSREERHAARGRMADEGANYTRGKDTGLRGLPLPAPEPRGKGRGGGEIRRDLEALEKDVSRLKLAWRDYVLSG